MVGQPNDPVEALVGRRQIAFGPLPVGLPLGGVQPLEGRRQGGGLPPELEGPYARRDRELSRGHLGLYNVDTILQKYYGQGFGLFLENCPDGAGAAVTATLPLRYEEEEPVPC